MKRRLLRLAVILPLVVIVFTVAVVLFEDRFIYFPSREGDWEALSRAGVAHEDVWLTCADGVRIHAWYLPAEGARATILYLHGNAGNIADRADWIERMTGLPANVLAIDYRGYGRSDGEPSEAGLYADAEAAYRHLVARGERAERIILLGESLGGGPAVELASRLPVGGVILMGPFTGARDMASRVMPLLPVRWFMRTRFDNLARIGSVEAPVRIIHSRDDEIVPYEMAERLFAAAREPKTLVTLEGAGHNDMIGIRAPEVLSAIEQFIP